MVLQMKKLTIPVTAIACFSLSACMDIDKTNPTPTDVPNFEIVPHGVIVRPTDQNAQDVRVLAETNSIFRITATPNESFDRHESLVVLPDMLGITPEIREDAGSVFVDTGATLARIDRETGQVAFFDDQGQQILAEKPRRSFVEIDDQGETAYTIHQVFDSADDEGFYGLGQHQNGQFNYNGENVELAQHNISIASPMLVSTGGYGIYWDNTSITRFGDPRPFQGFGESLIVRGPDGQNGLVGKYYRDDEVLAVVRETDPDYQFLPIDEWATGEQLRDVWPAPFGPKPNDGPDKVTWDGTIEAETAGLHKFRVYASHYIKVWIDGDLVVDRWRQNWNPYFFNFELEMEPGDTHDVKVEWIPNAGYFRMQHLDPMPAEDRRSLSLSSEVADVIDYYFIAGKTMDDVLSGYRDLSGENRLLPRWAYGFWQSRERYKTQNELLDVLQEYRQRQIPIDNIVLDWNYWEDDSWGSHEFDANRFPDPKAMIDAVHDLNAQIMISVWPKFYPTTDNYKELDAKGHIYQRNIELETRDWIGKGYLNSFYDPYSEEARTIFWRQMEENLDVLGFDAWWMDATEPDIHSNLSYEERKLRAGPTALGSGSRYFNTYALENARSVYEGERAGADANERVFILTRSGFPGIQRYSAAVWSGDIVSRWDDLRDQISAGTNVSMSGMPNWTFDIGGFAVEQRYASEDPAHLKEWRELNTRWYQFGAFAPIFRSHGQYPFREIFNIAEEGSVEYESMVKYNKLRYQLLPYIYTVAGDMTHDYGALMRGLPMDFPDDLEARNIGEQYMFGPSILVNPVYEFEARSRRLYLPAGTSWYDFHSSELHAGGQWINADAPLSDMPLYVRAGAIIPMGPDVQYHDEKPAGDVTLMIYPGADGFFSLYEDDGETYDYVQGEWSRIPLNWNDATQTLTIGAVEGKWRVADSRHFSVRWAGSDTPPVSIQYTGDAIEVNRP